MGPVSKVAGSTLVVHAPEATIDLVNTCGDAPSAWEEWLEKINIRNRYR
jgi:hypothetical protein